MYGRRRIGVCLLLAVMSVIVFSAAARAAENAPRISKEEVRSLLGDAGVIILDARTGSSWSASDKKVKGAVRVDPSDVDAWADSIPKDKMIVVYCSWMDEATSVRVVLKLKARGFKNVFALKGGWNAWIEAGYPVEKK